MTTQSIPNTSIEQASHILRNAVATRRDEIGTTHVASAIQATVWQNGELLLDEALGYRHFDVPNSADNTISYSTETRVGFNTPMDIASLTKPLVTATLLMQAVDEGLAEFDDPISKFCPEWSQPISAAGLDGVEHPDSEVGDEKIEVGNAKKNARDSATLLHLLNHSSGLPGWEKFYLRYPLAPSPKLARQTRSAVMESITHTPLEAPPGTRHCYSDLGYLLLGHIVEKLLGNSLHILARKRIFAPLGMSHTRYVAQLDGEPAIESAAATEDCALRERLVCGTVHDENTEIIGGVAGHAGVFSTARDLLKFCAHLLAIDRGTLADTGIISAQTLHFCLSDEARSANATATPGHHLGGWDTPSGKNSSAGKGFRQGRTIGHLGFSGTSFWIERDLGIVAILLTNRVYPSRENARIKPLRVAFHEALLPG